MTGRFRLQSGWGVGGGLALLDIVVHSADNIIIPILSLIGGLSGRPIIASITSWFLFFFILYKLAPLPYSLIDNFPRKEWHFQIIFAVGAVSLALLLNYMDIFTTVEFTIIFLLHFIFSAVILIWYFSYVLDWSLLDPHGKASNVLGLFYPQTDNAAEVVEREMNAVDGSMSYVYFAFHLFAIGGVIAFPIILTGVVIYISAFIYPIPELLVLGGAVLSPVYNRLPISSAETRVLSLEFDIEGLLVDAFKSATRGPQGLASTTMALLGTMTAAGYLGFSAVLFANSITLISRSPAMISDGDLIGFLIIWNLIGVIALSLFSGLFSLWGWIREFYRLPHFLDEWERENNQDLAEGELIARPPGFIIFPVITFFIAIGFVFGVEKGIIAARSPIFFMYAGAWPLVVLIGWWVYRRTFDLPVQPTKYENYWIAISVPLQFLPILVLLYLLGGLQLAKLIEEMTLVIGSFMYINGFTIVERYRTTKESPEYATMWYSFGGAGVSLLGVFLSTARSQTLLSVACISLVLIGVLQLVSERYESSLDM